MIKPSDKISRFISELTGITNEMLDIERSFGEVYQEIIDSVGNRIIVGHNVNFDINFLYDKLQEYQVDFSNDFIDTLRMSRIIDKS